MNQEELRKLMDCCQPVGQGNGPDDVAEPEMAALYQTLAEDPQARDQFQAIQAWDSEIGRAMQNVPVPEGLVDRLLGALEQSESGVKGGPATPVGVSRGSWWNRWPTRVATAVVAIAAVVTVVTVLAPWPDNLTESQVAESSLQWCESLKPESWQPTREPFDRYPLDRSLRFYPVGWQSLAALNDTHAVAYLALVPQGQTNAYLLVVRTRRGRALRAVPPVVPDATTGGVCVGVWKNNDCLYVLMVPGNPSDYRRLLKPQAIAGSRRGITLGKV